MSGNRYTKKFNIDAVKQAAELSHAVAEVAAKLGVSLHSMVPIREALQRACRRALGTDAQGVEMKLLKAELKRVTESTIP